MDRPSRVPHNRSMESQGGSPFLAVSYAGSLEGSDLLQGLARLEGITLAPLGQTLPKPSERPAQAVLLGNPEDLNPSAVPPGCAIFVAAACSGLPEAWTGLPEGSLDAFCGAVAQRWPGLALALATSRLRQEFHAQSLTLDQLTDVSLALSTERSYRRLLDLILSRAILLGGCDAGSLYLVVPEEDGPPTRLLFAAAQNNSVLIPFKETELYISVSSLAGYVATTGETLAIEDAYAIAPGAPYRFNRAYDDQAGYRTKSLLVLPMKNHKGEITGVLQLINHKRDAAATLAGASAVEALVVPFDQATTKLCLAVGSLAAVAIENNRLYESIEQLFEGFVRASVTAIEQRDPTTSGHSYRVSILTVGLAEAVDRTPTGPLGPHTFSAEQLRELRYASLLHDFGKVGVREHVLVKAKKLYPHELERILSRLETARLCAERDALLKKVDLLMREGPRDVGALADMEEALAKALGDLDAVREVILRANEPSVLPEGDFSALQAIGAAAYVDPTGCAHPLLEPAEARVLSIRKGSLSEEERAEIESHVTHTFEFLSKIPWTAELKGVPGLAYGHHEKLNGRGYPRGIKAEDIPVQCRMMTVADIFDALSAADRPYKSAVPVDKALDILKLEVRDGMLDPHLVDLFIEAKVYEKTLDLRAGFRVP